MNGRQITFLTVGAIAAFVAVYATTDIPDWPSHQSNTVKVDAPTQQMSRTVAVPPKPAPKSAAEVQPQAAHTESPAATETPAEAEEPAPAPEAPTVQPDTEPTGDLTSGIMSNQTAPSTSRRLLDAQKRRMTLIPAPVEELVVATPDGLLPRIGPDGRQAWYAYARPVATLPATAPKISILIVDLGLSERLTKPVLEQLPGQVSVAFSAYSPNLAGQIENARMNGINGGREVFLDIPAEPTTYPEEDPGPEALLTRLTGQQNLKRLRPFIAKAPGIVGTLSTQGTRFTTDTEALAPVLQEMNLRGLAWVDVNRRVQPTTTADGTQIPPSVTATASLAPGIGTTVASADIWLDDVLSPAAIRSQIAAAIILSRKQGHALIIARPYPLTIGMLNDFVKNLPSANIALVPVSAILKKAE